MANATEPGGFLSQTLPSPPPSGSSTNVPLLPRPRSSALRPGSSKESDFVSFVEGRLLAISGRYERRHSPDRPTGPEIPPGSTSGYQSFSEVAKDLRGLIDTIWVSGTPSLQIPLLLNIADSTLKYVEPFPFNPKATFELFRKLDQAFSSLLEGVDPESGDRLPGFETGRKVTMTEQVRLRGIVERSRVLIVKLESGEAVQEVEDPDTATDTDVDMESSYSIGLDQQDDWAMDTARVYEKTLVALGSVLDLVPPHTSAGNG